MKKIVINRIHGGFSLSRAAFLRLKEVGNESVADEPDYGEPWRDGKIRENRFNIHHFARTIARDDPDLIAVVEELGEQANGEYAELEVVEIPDDVEWQLEEYDGLEWIAEKHRTWPD